MFLQTFGKGADAGALSYVAKELEALTPQCATPELEVASEHTACLLPAFVVLPARKPEAG